MGQHKVIQGEKLLDAIKELKLGKRFTFQQGNDPNLTV